MTKFKVETMIFTTDEFVLPEGAQIVDVKISQAYVAPSRPLTDEEHKIIKNSNTCYDWMNQIYSLVAQYAVTYTVKVEE